MKDLGFSLTWVEPAISEWTRGLYPPRRGGSFFVFGGCFFMLFLGWIICLWFAAKFAIWFAGVTAILVAALFVALAWGVVGACDFVAFKVARTIRAHR